MEELDNALFKQRLLTAAGNMLREKDIPMYKVAELCDIPESTFSDYLHGAHLPNMKNFYKICKTLNVSSDWLLGLSDERGGGND